MGDLTIDELAQQSGLTVRNIRSHHTRGLLPPPEVRGRTGYYGHEHLERLALIQELQADGLPLRLVERLLTARSAAADRLLALRRTVLAPLESAPPTTTTVAEISDRFGAYDDEDLARAVRIGALVPRKDGTFLVPQPELLDTAAEVTRHGVSLKRALLVAEDVLHHSQDAARTFVDMVFEEIWMPFDEAGRPEARWAEVAAAIDAVRPLAPEIFLQLLPRAITAEVERVFGEVLRDQAEAEDAEPAAD
ncbi:MAG: MerR family transcriptional regulator [Solirubrobacteraceae bacterium]|nr:MerR family transcriptional regulator [Patulibacter sp.]